MITIDNLREKTINLLMHKKHISEQQAEKAADAIMGLVKDQATLDAYLGSIGEDLLRVLEGSNERPNNQGTRK